MEYRLIAILLFSLVILLLIGIFLIWHRINKNRARLAKETQEATSSLVKNFEILREEIQKREDYFYNKSERWQESERGELYQDNTFEIENNANDIESAIDSIKQIL